MRYKLTISYDGSEFYGFQKQPNLTTVQGEIEKVLFTFFQKKIDIVASGRTDAKVHAIGQVAHFDVDTEIENIGKFVFSINSMLPKSIDIVDCEKVSDDFHARFSAKRKTYLYKIYLSKSNEPLRRKYAHICSYNLDIDKMKKACEKFLGIHDFKAFCIDNPQIKTTTRTIYDIHMDVLENDKEIDLYITGNGFLHNMVRSIAGTLVDVGRGRFDIDYIDTIFESKDHQKAGKTLDGCGLYLLRVDYSL